MEYLKLHKEYPPLQIGQDCVNAVVAELIAFTRERLSDVITDDRLIMYVRNVMGEKNLDLAVIQKTMRYIEERDYTFIKIWKKPAEHIDIWIAGETIRQIEKTLRPHMLGACDLCYKLKALRYINLILLQY